MKVSELMTLLKTVDPDREVMIEVHEDGCGEDCLDALDFSVDTDALAEEVHDSILGMILIRPSKSLVTAESIE